MSTSSSEGEGEEHVVHNSQSTSQNVVFALFIFLLMGARVRHMLQNSSIPYTVVLLLLGLAIGALAKNYSEVAKYTTVADIDPHLLLHVFLPILLFESSFSLDYHVFVKLFPSIMMLAVPGKILFLFSFSIVRELYLCLFILYFFCIFPLVALQFSHFFPLRFYFSSFAPHHHSTFYAHHVFLPTISPSSPSFPFIPFFHTGVILATAATAGFCYFVFPYDFTLSTYLLLGAILSATDPVAVVALLRELGASKKLATLIEGESLLNDGTAIVVFLVLKSIVISEEDGSGADVDVPAVLMKFAYVSMGGPVVGYILGVVAVYWLGKVYNDTLVEITITLGFTYAAFFIAEEHLGVSGVLAVVVYGLHMNSKGRTRITAAVEHFLHDFYEMMAYLANTVIFVLCGVIVAQKTVLGATDLAYLLALYVGIHFVRAAVVTILSPLLTKTGYGLSFGDGVLLVHGGLRGSVGLALAIIVKLEIGGDIGNKFITFVSGIVVLTLILNGTTIQKLLSLLGMDKMSSSKQTSIRNAIHHLHSEAHIKINALKRDPFLGEANWNLVRSYWYFPDPPKGDSFEDCSKLTHHDQVRIDARRRFLHATKQSYWHQFEEGLLGHNAVTVLTSLVDNALDTDNELVLYDALQEHMRIPAYLLTLRDWTRMIPKVRTWVKNSLFNSLFFAFHIGLGYIRAQEATLKLISDETCEDDESHFSIITDPIVAKETKELCYLNTELVRRRITSLREAHPEVSTAIKTVFASKQILNHQLMVLKKMHSKGGIEEEEFKNLVQGVDDCMKRLHFSPPSVTSQSMLAVLQEVGFLQTMDRKVLIAIEKSAAQKSYEEGEFLIKEGQDTDGMYIILRGLVRIEANGKLLAHEGPGTAIGELSVLTGGKRKANVLADTIVSALFVSDKIMRSLMRRIPNVRTKMWQYASIKIAETMLSGEKPFCFWKPEDVRHLAQTGSFIDTEDDPQQSLTRHVKVSYVAVLLKGSVREVGKVNSQYGQNYVISGRKVFFGPCVLRVEDTAKVIVMDQPNVAGQMGISKKDEVLQVVIDRDLSVSASMSNQNMNNDAMSEASHFSFSISADDARSEMSRSDMSDFDSRSVGPYDSREVSDSSTGGGSAEAVEMSSINPRLRSPSSSPHDQHHHHLRPRHNPKNGSLTKTPSGNHLLVSLRRQRPRHRRRATVDGRTSQIANEARKEMTQVNEESDEIKTHSQPHDVPEYPSPDGDVVNDHDNFNRASNRKSMLNHRRAISHQFSLRDLNHVGVNPARASLESTDGLEVEDPGSRKRRTDRDSLKKSTSILTNISLRRHQSIRRISLTTPSGVATSQDARDDSDEEDEVSSEEEVEEEEEEEEDHGDIPLPPPPISRHISEEPPEVVEDFPQMPDFPPPPPLPPNAPQVEDGELELEDLYSPSSPDSHRRPTHGYLRKPVSSSNPASPRSPTPSDPCSPRSDTHLL